MKKLRLFALAMGSFLWFSPVAEAVPVWEEFAHHVTEVCNKVKPAVVHVEVVSLRSGQRRRSLGSGLVVAGDGKIVTNFHVIDHAETVHVLLDDGSKYPATVVRSDKSTDLAVLQIHPPRTLPSLPLGDSDKAEVGEFVIAVGNPFGFDRTVSLGILSGKRRYLPEGEGEFRPLNDFLQTDASIDPGSSGGPLVNLKGEVIGVNSQGIGRGQGFTIPSKTIRDVLEGTQIKGQLERGWLGLYPQPLTRELRDFWKMDRKGLLVSDVAPGSPAQAGGLRAGDVLVSLDGTALEAEKDEDISQFAQSISRYAPGSKIKLEYMRGKMIQIATITLGQQPVEEGREVEADFGAVFGEVTLNDQLQFRLEEAHGVIVRSVSPSTPAQWSGLSAGDLVLECNGQAISSLEALEALVRPASKKPVLLKVRQGKLIHFALVERKGAGPAP